MHRDKENKCRITDMISTNHNLRSFRFNQWQNGEGGGGGGDIFAASLDIFLRQGLWGGGREIEKICEDKI